MYHCDTMEKADKEVCDLDLMFNVTMVPGPCYRLLESTFPALFLLNPWVDFNQTYIDTWLRERKKFILFW